MIRQENSKLPVKLELRRYFLRKYSDEPLRVFDAFQAQGVIWRELRKEFAVASYWGVDLVAKKGRLQVDSARILEQPGWLANVLDLDAFGSPWAHYRNALRTAANDLTIFLTWGSGSKAGGGLRARLSRSELRAIGVSFWIPICIEAKLRPFVFEHAISAACERFKVVEAAEACAVGGEAHSTRYFGIRLELKK